MTFCFLFSSQWQETIVYAQGCPNPGVSPSIAVDTRYVIVEQDGVIQPATDVLVTLENFQPGEEITLEVRGG